jgi:hypothetical protein
MNASRRSIEFALLTLFGIPGDIWCGMFHICMDGHLYHKEMPHWWLYVDFVWVAAFVAAAISALKSDLKSRLIPFGLLLFLVFSRMLLASGGGAFMIFELPVLIYLAILSVSTIRRVWRQRRSISMEPAAVGAGSTATAGDESSRGGSFRS